MKVKRLLLLLSILIISLLCLCSCSNNNQHGNHVEVAQAYAQKYNRDIDSVIFECYGEFNGAYVVLFDGLAGQAITRLTVDGITFTFPTTRQFTVYYNGEFCNLQEAFDKGIISHNDLVKLKKNYTRKDFVSYGEYKYPENYPNPPDDDEDEDMPKDKHEAIAYIYAKQHNFDKDIVHVKCYAEFNNACVTNINVCDPIEGTTYLTVDDVTYVFPTAEQFTVYYDGEFFDLQEAFDAALLTHDDLVDLKYIHRESYYDLYAKLGTIELTVDEQNMITSAYANLHNISEDLVLYDCYGRFDGTYVLYFYSVGSAIVTHLTVDGVGFVFGSSVQFKVYHDGEFCNLQEAFDNGFLSHDDLLELRKNHEASWESLYKD